jgi:hypothetical protein
MCQRRRGLIGEHNKRLNKAGRHKDLQWQKRVRNDPLLVSRVRNNYLINIDNKNKKSRMGLPHSAYLKMLKTLFLSL